jgi:hypothetical protein
LLRLSLGDFTTVGTLDYASLATGGTSHPLNRAVANCFSHDGAGLLTVMFRDNSLFVTNDGAWVTQFDLNTFVTGNIKFLDITAKPQYSAIAGRGCYNSGWHYFGGGGWVFRINAAHTSCETLNVAYGAFDPANNSVGFDKGVWANGTYLWVAGNWDDALVKVDLASSGTFSSCTFEWIAVGDITLGDNPIGDRGQQGFRDIIGDSDRIYLLGTCGNYVNAMLRRVQQNQGAYFPSPTKKPPDQLGWQGSNWAGGDTYPTLTNIIHYSNAVYSGLTKANNRKYIIAGSIRFETAGAISSMQLGGQTATKIVESTNGALYAGIWIVEDFATAGGTDFDFTATVNVLYYEFDIFYIDGWPSLDATSTFVGSPLSGSGTVAAFPFDAPAGGFVIASFTADADLVDANFRNYLDDTTNFGTGLYPQFSYDNQDTWGPDDPPATSAYSDGIALLQFYLDNDGGAAITGATVNIDWTADSGGSRTWAGCVVALNPEYIATNIDKYIKGVSAAGLVSFQTVLHGLGHSP